MKLGSCKVAFLAFSRKMAELVSWILGSGFQPPPFVTRRPSVRFANTGSVADTFSAAARIRIPGGNYVAGDTLRSNAVGREITFDNVGSAQPLVADVMRARGAPLRIAAALRIIVTATLCALSTLVAAAQGGVIWSPCQYEPWNCQHPPPFVVEGQRPPEPIPINDPSAIAVLAIVLGISGAIFHRRALRRTHRET